MGIVSIAKKWAEKHIKVISVDESSVNAELSIDRDSFEALRKLYIQNGGKYNNAMSFTVRITSR